MLDKVLRELREAEERQLMFISSAVQGREEYARAVGSIQSLRAIGERVRELLSEREMRQ